MTEEERLRQFLLAIHMEQGKVCPNYGTCTHDACRSSHMTWEMADAALQGMTLEQYRQEKALIDMQRTELASGNAIAIALQCFKCGARGVRARPAPGELAMCKACGARDVVVIEVERTPDGFINNCAMHYEGSAERCQMCGGGPCPEAVKFK